MSSANPKIKYKLLLSILLGEYILVEVLTAAGINWENDIVNLIATVICTIPLIILLNTVSKDTKFKPHIRGLAEIAIWAIVVCAAGAFLVEYLFPLVGVKL